MYEGLVHFVHSGVSSWISVGLFTWSWRHILGVGFGSMGDSFPGIQKLFMFSQAYGKTQQGKKYFNWTIAMWNGQIVSQRCQINTKFHLLDFWRTLAQKIVIWFDTIWCYWSTSSLLLFLILHPIKIDQQKTDPKSGNT